MGTEECTREGLRNTQGMGLEIHKGRAEILIREGPRNEQGKDLEIHKGRGREMNKEMT